MPGERRALTWRQTARVVAQQPCDPARNRDSIRRLAALEPAVVCFGHGPPARDPGALTAFAAALPA